jgi:glutamate dehydrogenase
METAKVDLLVRAVSEAGRHPDPTTAALIMRFYRDTSPEDLLGRDPIDVIGAVLSQRRLAQTRPQGTAVVRVLTPTVQDNGWGSPHTVVQIVTDDMPFLVDSVTAELSTEGRAVHLVVHPQFAVRRNLQGELEDIVGLVPGAVADGGPDAVVESWMAVEIDRETDPVELAEIEDRLRLVLRDVRESVEDWPKMRQAATTLADELMASPPSTVSASEALDSAEFLRWLAANNFTFIGYREYDLSDEDGEVGLVGVPGSGLGVLRSDTGSSQAVAKLPPAARQLAREPHVLVLTKANARSTVHRNAYLDYVGVKRFDADGNVTGERRFIGLFTSSAYTHPVTAIPLISRKISDVLERSEFREDGHSYKDLLRVLETYPRDELFQIDTSALFDTAIAVLYMQGRRQTRVFLGRDP